MKELMIMEKKMYIEPKMETAVLPKDAMMGFNNSPGEEFNPKNTAPKRIAPVMPNDTVAVF